MERQMLTESGNFASYQELKKVGLFAWKKNRSYRTFIKIENIMQ